MAKSLKQQISDAWEARAKEGMTMPELLAKTRLRIDVSSLSRKVRGKQPIDVDTELDAIATALGIELRVGRERRAS